MLVKTSFQEYTPYYKQFEEKEFKSEVFDYYETMIYMYMYVLASLPRGHLEFEFNDNNNIQIKATKLRTILLLNFMDNSLVSSWAKLLN